jgi:hypothetical protein
MRRMNYAVESLHRDAAEVADLSYRNLHQSFSAAMGQNGLDVRAGTGSAHSGSVT